MERDKEPARSEDHSGGGEVILNSTNYILNEAAVKAMNIKDPIGKSFVFHDKKGTIAGVASDFHFQNLHKKNRTGNPVL